MKKFIVILSFIIFLVGCACSVSGGAKESVYIFLEKYKYLDKNLVKDIDNYVAGESLNENQKEKYKEILKRQYKDMSYEIKKEEYIGNKAYVTINISVYDLYKAQDETENYLKEHESEFLNSDGEYDDDKYIDYKLDFMLSYQEKTTEELKLELTKNKNIWVLEQPSIEELKKIHGMNK